MWVDIGGTDMMMAFRQKGKIRHQTGNFRRALVRKLTLF